MAFGKTWRILSLAFLVGLVIAIGDAFYCDYAYHHRIMTPDGLWLLLLFLNPPSFLGIAFIDIKPTTTQLATLHGTVALLNGTLYSFAAYIFLRVRRKSA